MERLWSHQPILSDEPWHLVRHKQYSDEKKDFFDEIAVFELKNGKFLFIRCGGMISNPDFGYTESDEYDTLDEAIEQFELYEREDG